MVMALVLVDPGASIVFLRRKERWPKVKLRNPFIIIQCTSGCLINSGVSRLLGVIGWAGGMEGKQREIGRAEGTGRGIGGQEGHAGYSAYPHVVVAVMKAMVMATKMTRSSKHTINTHLLK